MLLVFSIYLEVTLTRMVANKNNKIKHKNITLSEWEGCENELLKLSIHLQDSGIRRSPFLGTSSSSVSCVDACFVSECCGEFCSGSRFSMLGFVVVIAHR